MRTDTEQRLSAIEARNTRVELDKAWETSWTRRLSIAGLTYGIVSIYLFITGNDQPFVDAFVPPAGFLVSTLLLTGIKDLWQKLR